MIEVYERGNEGGRNPTWASRFYRQVHSRVWALDTDAEAVARLAAVKTYARIRTVSGDPVMLREPCGIFLKCERTLDTLVPYRGGTIQTPLYFRLWLGPYPNRFL